MKEVSIAWILQNLGSTCDFGEIGSDTNWVEIIAKKFNEPLVADMLENGQVDAICISKPGTWNGSECWKLGNGHHRLVAAIMLGWDTIRVTDGPGEWNQNGYVSDLDFDGANNDSMYRKAFAELQDDMLGERV